MIVLKLLFKNNIITRGKKMLNIIWPIFIIISYIYATFSGRLENVNNAIFEYTKTAVDLTITLLGTMCLWNGLMEIASNTKLINRINKVLSPLVNFLFSENKNNKKIHEEISMNIVANMLGLGNAATPLGLKAMKSMQENNKNKERLTDDMATFIILNTASIQIIPTTVISIRMSLGSIQPTKIIFAVWFSTICAAIVGIVVTKICIKLKL